MTVQNILPIERPYRPRLDNFVIGDNQELLNELAVAAAGFRGLWIFGEQASGRSHLLQACASVPNGFYIACDSSNPDRIEADFVARGVEVLSALAALRSGTMNDEGSSGVAMESAIVIAIDDAAAIRGLSRAEETMMNLYEQCKALQARFLVSHDHAAQHIDFVLADLNSRLRALSHFQLVPLDDRGKARVLRLRAEQRGYDLNEAVLDYWLRRGPRSLNVLLDDLQRLDQATLERQRLLTIPLLKEILGY